MPVTFDSKTLGQTASKTYFYWDGEPGKDTLARSRRNTPTIEVNARADNIYYVWQEVKMGAFAARFNLHLVDEAKGKKGVPACSLAQVQSD